MEQVSDLRRRYLQLMKDTLTGMLIEDVPTHAFPFLGYAVMEPDRYVKKWREYGRDLPSQAFTSIGMKRMDNLQMCVEQVLADDVPGDLIETGVWRGGAVIFMRALLAAYGVTDRTVWVADSFQGLPDVDANTPQDALWKPNVGWFATDQAVVQANFAKFGFDDDQVRYLPGWFKDTLPTAPIDQLAVLRLDGDLYASTMDALTHLYPKVAPGGYVIVDDYVISSCREAIHDYRAAHGIEEPIQEIDGWSVYWRRSCARR